MIDLRIDLRFGSGCSGGRLGFRSGKDERTLVAASGEREQQKTRCTKPYGRMYNGRNGIHCGMLQHGGRVEESAFLALADAELVRLEGALEQLQETGTANWDYEEKPGGILELEFADGSKIVINRHLAAREIWVAARAGGFHFKPPQQAGQPWCDSRSGETLDAVLSRCISAQAGVPQTLGSR